MNRATHSIQEFYDVLWSTAGMTIGPSSPHEAARLSKIESALERIAGTRRDLSILDLGCGTGWLAPFLSRFGPVTGVDFSEKAIAIAREGAATHSVRFVVRDFLMSSLDDLGIFDVVVSSEVIEHVPDPLKPRFIEIVSQALARKGFLILTTPNGGVRDRYFSVASSRQPIEDWITREVQHKLLSPYFEVIDSHSFVLNFDTRGIYRVLNSRKVNKILHATGVHACVESYVERHWFGLYAIYVARKI